MFAWIDSSEPNTFLHVYRSSGFNVLRVSFIHSSFYLRAFLLRSRYIGIGTDDEKD